MANFFAGLKDTAPITTYYIDYIEKSGRFAISVPTMLFDKIRAIPNRRMDKASGRWIIPATRLNVQVIEASFPDKKKYSREAVRAMKNILKDQDILQRPGFPRGYQFKTQPYPHQQKACDLGFGRPVFAFFMDMGTGKSKVIVDMAIAGKAEGQIDSVLIVCPVSIRHNWLEQIEIHAPNDYERTAWILSTTAGKFQAWSRQAGDKMRWLIVGVESLSAGKAAAIAEQYMLSGNVMMVVDESSKIKTHSANRTKACIKLGKLAEQRYILSGTPADNPMDLFSQFQFLDTDIIGAGDFYSFRGRYAVMGGFEGREVIGYQNQEELIEAIKPHTYQVLKADVLADLPEKSYAIRTVEMSDNQAELYQDIVRNAGTLLASGGEVQVKNVLEKMLRAQQVVAGFVGAVHSVQDPLSNKAFEVIEQPIPGGSPKIPVLLEVLEGHRGSAVIWCVFRNELRTVAEALKKEYGTDQVQEFYGAIKPAHRQELVNQFQNKEFRFLVANTATGGMGLTLTAADLAVYMSNTFSYEQRIQSEDRLHRIGQRNPVLYVDIIAQSTIDRLIMRAIRDKIDMANLIRTALREEIDVRKLLAGEV